jgi:hypothetical protein
LCNVDENFVTLCIAGQWSDRPSAKADAILTTARGMPIRAQPVLTDWHCASDHADDNDGSVIIDGLLDGLPRRALRAAALNLFESVFGTDGILPIWLSRVPLDPRDQ